MPGHEAELFATPMATHTQHASIACEFSCALSVCWCYIVFNDALIQGTIIKQGTGKVLVLKISGGTDVYTKPLICEHVQQSQHT